jgi:hypothetical protein
LRIKHFATTSFSPSRPVKDENQTNFTSAKINATMSDVVLKTIDTEEAKTMKKEQVTSFPATEITVKNICTLEAK